MDLFERQYQQLRDRDAPLAARMRPRSLDEFIGQEGIVGPGRLLRRAIQADQLTSVIFYGPPGTGKTTLAQIIANTTQAQFIAINAVLAGVKEIREAVETAKVLRGQHGQRTILFIDEVHRFNKAQQDALLPWVENGTLTLIGATTENPYFEVNKALVSRSRLFQLQPLTATHLQQVLVQAIADPRRGYGERSIDITPEATAHWTNIANGDARTVLNALELAVETTTPDLNGLIFIDLAVAEASIQQRAVLYDKEGDAHFDTISAFIKSLRGSDPDAALYWLARMVYAGEDPHFILRRMLILASEDIGLADPQAVVVVTACAQAFDRIGLPEGQYPLAQAALYLATAPKSNRVLGYFDALVAVEKEREFEIPNPLKDANRDKEGFGHGAGYIYPHAYREHWVAQQYLPTALQGEAFYQPSDQGYEGQIRDRLNQQREAQQAALVEQIDFTADILSYSPPDTSTERWLQRTINQTGQHLAHVRARIFEKVQIQRHHLVLDLQANSGLLTWEAARRVPEGGVFAVVTTTAAAQKLQSQADALPVLTRPIILSSLLRQLVTTLHQQHPDIKFDWIVGRNALSEEIDKISIAKQLSQVLSASGKIILAERLPRAGQRLYQWLPGITDNKLFDRWQVAEENIYDVQTGDPLLNEDVSDWIRVFEAAGFVVQTELETTTQEIYITPKLIDRWFANNVLPSSYADRLSHSLSAKDIEKIRSLMTEQLLYQTRPWYSVVIYMTAQAAISPGNFSDDHQT
jgi:putative ATPase